MRKYSVIYADPPWPEQKRGKTSNRLPEWARTDDRKDGTHYKTMSAEDILSLPIGRIAAKDCALFLWTTPRHVPLALSCVESWGFDFVTIGFTWMKRNKNNGEPFFGLGYYTRSNTEFVLLNRRGSPKLIDKTISSAVYEPRREHSRKPDTVRKRIECLFGDVPRIELFARERHPGWDVWGDEVPSDPGVKKLFERVLNAT